eukprot:1259216-Pyramimonas_sp.AAC.1
MAERKALTTLDPNLPSKFRPVHSGATAHIWVAQPDVVVDTKKAAKDALRAKTGFHWVRKSPQTKPPGELLQCNSHVNCPAVAKVVLRDGKWVLYMSPMEHAAAASSTTRTCGIPLEYLNQVDELLINNNGKPTFVANQFVLSDAYRYGSLAGGNNKHTLPSAAQCKSRFEVLKARA